MTNSRPRNANDSLSLCARAKGYGLMIPVKTTMLFVGFGAIVALVGCSTTETPSSQTEFIAPVPGMAVDADFEDLTPEQQDKVVTYREGIEALDSPPWPIGGWESVAQKMRLPHAEKGRVNSGIVRYELILDTEGNVRRIRILEGFRADVDRIVMEAVRSTKFKPAVLDGVPVATKLRHWIAIELANPNQTKAKAPQ